MDEYCFLKRDQTLSFSVVKSLCFTNWQDNLTLNKAQHQCNTMRGHEALKEALKEDHNRLFLLFAAGKQASHGWFHYKTAETHVK